MSGLFVIPPYLHSEGHAYSFVPLIIAAPERLLGDRVKLSGARLFDEEALRRNKPSADSPDDLPALAGIANVAVSATWTADGILRIQDSWRSHSDLPNDLASLGSCILSAPPPDAFMKAVTELLGQDVSYGVGYANLTKVLALASRRMFPMLDRYLRGALSGHGREAAPGRRPYLVSEFGFLIDRSRRLLRALQQHLDGIAPPPQMPYSALEKLDRLIWMARWGAGYYSRPATSGGRARRRAKPASRSPLQWVSVSELPCKGLLEPEAWSGRKPYVLRYAMKRARIVLPADQIAAFAPERNGFDTRFPGLCTEGQAEIERLLTEAGEVARGYLDIPN